MKLHKNLLLLGVTTIFLTACGGQTNGTEDNNVSEVEDLKLELEEANKRIAELETEMEESNETDDPAPSSTDNEDIVEDNPSNMFGLNETVSIGTDTTEMFRLTITRATNNQDVFPDHMIGLDDYNTDRIIAISIDYENVAFEGGFRPSSHDFQAYTKEGQSLERINQQSGQDAISEGRKATTQIYFDFPEDTDEVTNIEVDYLDYGDVLATFDLPVE